MSAVKSCLAGVAAFLALVSAFDWGGLVSILPPDYGRWLTTGITAAAVFAHFFAAVSKLGAAAPEAPPAAPQDRDSASPAGE